MTDELKIIMNTADDGTILNTKSLLYVNDEVIGCIQDLKIHLSVKSALPLIEVTFPNFHDPEVDQSYINQVNGLSKDVDLYINILKKFPNVKIRLQNIFATCSDEEEVYELGTNGIIEHVPTEI